MSTGGLHCPVSTPLRLSGVDGTVSTEAGSTVSATSADRPNESLPELLRAAASVLAAAATGSSLHGPTDRGDIRLGSADGDRSGRSRHRRLSQSVVSSVLSAHPFNQSSGAASGELDRMCLLFPLQYLDTYTVISRISIMMW